MKNNRQRLFSDKGNKRSNVSFDADMVDSSFSESPVHPRSEQNVDSPDHRIRKSKKTRADKKLKVTGLLFFGLGISFMFIMPTHPTVTTTAEARSALETQMSTQLPVGVKIMSEDQNLAGHDFTIEHSSPANESNIHVWDYAAEDGDYVQILVDGVALGNPFMIKNKPAVFSVPTTGEIQVLGTRDGGGGITYAIHYDINGTTYFNGTDVGHENIYTLIRDSTLS